MLTRQINHRTPEGTMGKPQPLNPTTMARQVSRWSSVHPAGSERPPVIHPEVAMLIADWLGTEDEPAVRAFGRDGTIRETLLQELGVVVRQYRGLEFLMVRALVTYVQRAREVAP